MPPGVSRRRPTKGIANHRLGNHRLDWEPPASGRPPPALRRRYRLSDDSYRRRRYFWLRLLATEVGFVTLKTKRPLMMLKCPGAEQK
jgi:hypothetical protein